MPLSNKARRYIEKNRSKSASRIARDLNLDPEEVRAYLESLAKADAGTDPAASGTGTGKQGARSGSTSRKGPGTDAGSESGSGSGAALRSGSGSGSVTGRGSDQGQGTDSGPAGTRKVLFFAIMLSIPVLFFVFLELGLRWGNYRGNLELFIYPEIFRGEYVLPNPGFTGRYFFATTTNPTPSNDTFLAVKPENGFRLFVIGGSSAAGYPYGYNGTFSRVVKDMLQDVMPGKVVEVVNVATAAINTYTLYDQVDEILEHNPDAIMIYSGHNEYYGALGVGSAERLGSNPAFVRFYLRLQRLRTFMLIRDGLVRVTALFTPEPADAGERIRTLMERVVGERSIPLDSRLYERGKRQLESNLTAITRIFNAEDVPVFIGSLTSNLKDHPPFESVSIDNHPPADEVYARAKAAYNEGRLDEALEWFIYAKDLDALRFRAPAAFNEIIRDVAGRSGNYYVPVDETFLQSAENGIIGFDLMLEHLHPNRRGYFLMGTAYFEALRSADFLGREADLSRLQPYEYYYERMNMSEFDERVAWHRVQTLTNSWPFVSEPNPAGYPRGYRLQGLADSLAFQVVNSPLRWDEAKVFLGERLRAEGRSEEALAEYFGLIRDQPANDSPYVFAARIYLDRNDFQSARPLLEGALKLEESAYVTKMLGAIEVDAGNLDRGIDLLERSLQMAPDDAQALFNLSGAYGLKGRHQEAMDLARRVERLNPNFPGLRAWMAQLQFAINR